MHRPHKFQQEGLFSIPPTSPSASRSSVTYPALGVLFAEIFVPSLFPAPVTEVQLILDLWLTSVCSSFSSGILRKTIWSRFWFLASGVVHYAFLKALYRL